MQAADNEIDFVDTPPAWFTSYFSVIGYTAILLGLTIVVLIVWAFVNYKLMRG